MKNAIVTGGSRGIGRAVVQRLAQQGYDVTFTYKASGDAARELEKSARAGGWAVRAEQSDQASLSDHTRLLEQFRASGKGSLYALVINAGIAIHRPIPEVSEQQFDQIFATNIRGPLFLLRQLSPILVDGGRVVLVSSGSTAWPSPGEAVYAASKAALEQVCRIASRELGARRITVNAVCPGPTRTDLLEGHASPEALAGVESLTALGRIGTPDDIAGIVALLLDERAGWLTGQVIRADGGLT
jgi:3-oxoacyl-[acyl-carrier protein] reductase